MIEKCPRCGSEDVGLLEMINVSGEFYYKKYCFGGRHSPNFKNAIVDKNFARQFEWEGGKIEKGTDKRLEKCERCGKLGVELHHWAPFHLFGEDSESWPKSKLCRSCHMLWHKVVTPNMNLTRLD